MRLGAIFGVGLVLYGLGRKGYTMGTIHGSWIDSRAFTNRDTKKRELRLLYINDDVLLPVTFDISHASLS